MILLPTLPLLLLPLLHCRFCFKCKCVDVLIKSAGTVTDGLTFFLLYFQAQQRLEESSHKLDLIRLSLERLRGDLPPGSLMAAQVSIETNVLPTYNYISNLHYPSCLYFSPLLARFPSPIPFFPFLHFSLHICFSCLVTSQPIPSFPIFLFSISIPSQLLPRLFSVPYLPVQCNPVPSPPVLYSPIPSCHLSSPHSLSIPA